MTDLSPLLASLQRKAEEVKQTHRAFSSAEPYTLGRVSLQQHYDLCAAAYAPLLASAVLALVEVARKADAFRLAYLDQSRQETEDELKALFKELLRLRGAALSRLSTLKETK